MWHHIEIIQQNRRFFMKNIVAFVVPSLALFHLYLGTLILIVQVSYTSSKNNRAIEIAVNTLIQLHLFSCFDVVVVFVS